MVFDVYAVAWIKISTSYIQCIFVLLSTNPNIRCAEIIGETTSGEHRMKVFSMLALCKQWRKVVEACKFMIALAIMAFEIFVWLKALWQIRRIIPLFNGTPYDLVLNCIDLVTSSWKNTRWYDVPSNNITTQNQISSVQKTTKKQGTKKDIWYGFLSSISWCKSSWAFWEHMKQKKEKRNPTSLSNLWDVISDCWKNIKNRRNQKTCRLYVWQK